MVMSITQHELLVRSNNLDNSTYLVKELEISVSLKQIKLISNHFRPFKVSLHILSTLPISSFGIHPNCLALLSLVEKNTPIPFVEFPSNFIT